MQAHTNRSLLPIGIQDFRSIREGRYYYVDKTQTVFELVRQGKYYFLSRPRRFGKSLLISTLKSLFECDEELFKGLAIHKHWNWSVQHPVLRLSFDGRYGHPEQIEEDLLAQLQSVEQNSGLKKTETTSSGQVRLRVLLERLHQATGQRVVVLVDEYDKPILDVLDDKELAKNNRDYLRGLYGVIKGSADHVRFVFVSGISMFSKASLFSELNNLKDISLDPRYATICGYTENDLDEVFSPEIKDLSREKILHWYNGYNWLGEQKIYNPYDILELFYSRKFQPHWFKIGLPTYLYRLLVQKKINPITLENRIANEALITTFDVGDVSIEALLFQSGYLTIVEEVWNDVEVCFTLDYPNFEVRSSFNRGWLDCIASDGQAATAQGNQLIELLASNNFDEFTKMLQVYFAGIPHQWYDASEVAKFESYYAGMLYLVFRAIGIDLRVEDASSHGRADMVLFHANQIFVLEFKVAEDKAQTDRVLDLAIAQLQERGYASQYFDRGHPIHLLGLVFGREERNLLGFRTESI